METDKINRTNPSNVVIIGGIALPRNQLLFQRASIPH